MAKPAQGLSIGEPGDKYEIEADAMADAVTGKSGRAAAVQRREITGIRRKCDQCAEEEQLQTKIWREEKEEEPRLQTQLEEEDAIQAKAVEEEEEPLQRKAEEDELQMKREEEEEAVALKTKSSGSPGSGPPMSRRLAQSKGDGRALPAATRQQMEQAFGADFGKVNIHTGSRAVSMSEELHAQAFTHGNDIYFNSGKYRLETQSGQHLLAHELTHTLQQGSTFQKNIQRKIGDGHDLSATRFSGNLRLEAAYDNERFIGAGSQGPHVHSIQQALLELGYEFPVHGVDGIFGPETGRSVRSFQGDNQLIVDAIIGTETMGSLDSKFTSKPVLPGNSCKDLESEVESINTLAPSDQKNAKPEITSGDAGVCTDDKKPLCHPLPFPRNSQKATPGHICTAKQNAQIFNPSETNPIDGSRNFCLNEGDRLKILQRPNIKPGSEKLIMISVEVLSGIEQGKFVFIQEAYINGESCRLEEKKEKKKKKKKKKKEKEKEKKCIPTPENPFCLPIPKSDDPCTPFTSEAAAQATWDSLSVKIPIFTALATRCQEVGPVWKSYFNKTSKKFHFSDLGSCVVSAAKDDETAAKTAKGSADSKLHDIKANLPNTLDDIVPLPFPIFGLVATKRMSLSKAIGKHGPSYLHPALIFNNPLNAAANIAGDIGGSDIFGKDDRTIGGTVIIDVHRIDSSTGMMHGEVRWLPHIHVKDTVDFCPGNLGNSAQREFTLPMSKLEATGMTRDVPIAIDYNLVLRSSKFSVLPKSKR